MKTTKFYQLKNIRGNDDFNRKDGKHNVPGVYFWGFTLREDGQLPEHKNEMIVYYIGKDSKSIIRRIMEEVTQLIFGGYGTVFDKNWLVTNPFTAKLTEKQKCQPVPVEVLYKSEGLNVLFDFFSNTSITETLEWMKNRMIFSWIEVNNENDRSYLELEMHDYAKNNILGLGRRVNFPHKNKFNEINWNDNEILKEWLEEVRKNNLCISKTKKI